MRFIITLLITLSASIHIRAEYSTQRLWIYIFKPLTTGLIILLCLLQTPVISSEYRYLLLIGLGCSLCGDIFLMLPSDRFLHGLVSFLCAHLCYTAAFISQSGLHISFLAVIPAIVGGVLLLILLPHTKALTIPVILYTFIILTMLWQALERWGIISDSSAVLALIGAALFTASDAMLAYNRFVARWKYARLLILSTYYAAQWCLACSVKLPM